eukprot:TRINITY_DN56623_c0_g1_i1.p1 TRINITY_DN56623_c0_g1~~TRINITY_DN56623_c0_g1_i1.p1  ORF type:complete len:166 (-),score=31.59 TRINITY_DN56623_c0_g1_i1:42-539(-)
MAPIPDESDLQPGAVLLRDLDGLSFEVVLLQVRSDGEADVAYLDDGNVEQGVPLDELEVPDGGSRRTLTSDQQRMYDEGREQLASQALQVCEDASRPATASNMRWEQGRHVEDDGAIILSSVVGLLSPEVVKDPNAIVVPACGAGLRGIRSLRRNRRDVQMPAAA